MIGTRRALILLATSAVCCVALVPVRVGDARVPGWVEVFHDTGLVLRPCRFVPAPGLPRFPLVAC